METSETLGEVLQKHVWMFAIGAEEPLQVTVNFLYRIGWAVNHPRGYFTVGVGEHQLSNPRLTVRFNEDLTQGEGTYETTWWQRVWHRLPPEMPVKMTRGRERIFPW